MYTGNGATKNFPIPEGYDGSTVILTMPSGKGIKMTEGDGYEIKNNEVVFTAAVPEGITISFDENDAGELMSAKSGGYVVIYSDGTMKEVEEDPVLILEQSQKLLTEAAKKADEIKQLSSDSVSYLTGLMSTLQADLEGRLTGYAQRAEEIIAESASSVKSELRNDYAPTLEGLSQLSTEITGNLKAMELLREETAEIAITTARETKAEILSQCEGVITACADLKSLKAEIELAVETGRGELLRLKQEIAESIELHANQEIEMLKSLRLKMEEDYKMLSTRINNRWELLRGEIDGQ